MALPTDDGLVTRARYVALGVALLAQFPGRLASLDCGPRLGVLATWLTPPSVAEQTAFAATVNGWVWTEQPDESLERQLGMGRLLAACVLRASTQWVTASTAQKSRIQAIIDAGATRVIAALTASGSAPPVVEEPARPRAKSRAKKKKE